MQLGSVMQLDLVKSEGSSSPKCDQSLLQEETECGEICSYTSGRATPGQYYPFLRKAINCCNVMVRLVKPPGKVVMPPPTKPPKELYQEFIQFGKAPITRDYYFNDAAPYNKLNVPRPKDDKIIDVLRGKDRNNLSIGSYIDCPTMKKAMIKYKEKISGKRGLVIGTLYPWLEAMILNIGAKWVTTSEYAELSFVYPNVNTVTPYELGEEVLKGKVEQFDFAASFSSIEHSGLGRFGDPLNPYGDLEAVAEVWCMVKPGGYFFLGIPTSPGFEKTYIEFNAHRIYGVERLQHLTANWEVVDVFKDNQSVFILRKPL